MASFVWTQDPIGLIQSFEARYTCPEVGALFAWAASTVDGLHYLDDIDQAYDASHSVVGLHRGDIVDVAHARWATSTSITALNLCAAGLGRCFCAHKDRQELDLGSFDSARRRKQRADLRVKLPSAALQWVDGVLEDPEYKKIKAARDWLIHSRLKRHFSMASGGPSQRLKLEVDGTQLEIRYIVKLARDVATKHVTGFFDLLQDL